MICPDSSVLVAGAERGHTSFQPAHAALVDVRDAGALVAHTLAETYVVLTSTVYGHPPGEVLEYLGEFLDRPVIGLAPARYREALRELGDAGIVGGAIYDGLIALGARHAGATLISLDRRAARTYDRCGVEFLLLGAE